MKINNNKEQTDLFADLNLKQNKKPYRKQISRNSSTLSEFPAVAAFFHHVDYPHYNWDFLD